MPGCAAASPEGCDDRRQGLAKPEPAVKLKVRDLAVYYGPKKAVGPVSMDIVGQHVTALIGPSRLRQVARSCGR